jgi:isoleucyl-tRNA synthetase
MPESSTAKPEKNKYRSSLNLPKTSFAMKANLVQNEPASLKRWAKTDLYARTREARAGAPRFVFHDGPPYANGSIHLGHLMNKCLKDFVVRSQTMMGKDCPFVPGWDCHGLPIEHKVMGELVESGKIEKLNGLDDDTRRMAIRRECQKYASKFHKLHTGQMTRLLTLADYANPYLTMQPTYEGATLDVLVALLEQGVVYRALKAVHWSIANETALAEAELEYYDREDTSVFVDFEAADGGAVYEAFGLAFEAEEEEEEEEEEEDDSSESYPTTPSFMIWTTTPWTLPANLAIAVHPRFTYALVRMDGNVCVLAEALVEAVAKVGGAESVEMLATARGEKLLGLRYRHPFRDEAPTPETEPDADTSRCYSIVDAEYVTLEDGTGLVHTAPGHGHDDYLTGIRVGLPIYSPVRGNGVYDSTVPTWLNDLDVWEANEKIVEHLRTSGHLFHAETFTHSYPHDWRSKTPVIFRATEQWFIAADEPTKRDGVSLRDLALNAVADDGSSDPKVAFVPAWGRNRMRGMLESRPDWCISRQRAWGLPIPAFFGENDEVLMTPASVKAVAAVLRERGSDAWFTLSPAELLAGYDIEADPDAPDAVTRESLGTLTKGKDIFDVWFESGSSWNSVMRQRDLGFPVDLYLEGSDQHRGWFQLSLLPALGMTGEPPFKSVLTHGFMVNPDGRKLSKSDGDTIEDLFRDYGVDVLRWWVCSLSYENDVKVGREFFDLAGDNYRKVRNTLRFMLSNLGDYEMPHDDGRDALASVSPTSLDAWVLDAFSSMATRVAAAFEAYDFRLAHTLIYDFCNETLSATYLAAVKDRLYCDKADSPRRRQTQALLWNLTDGLCRLLAPVMCHTADEAFRALRKCEQGDTQTCVHLAEFVTDFGIKADPVWERVMVLRDDALLAMERAKSDMGVDNPLDASVTLPDADGSLEAVDPGDLADLLGVSRVDLDARAESPSVGDLRDEPRCERSWKRDKTVRQRSDGGMLSDRDAEAIGLL